MIKKIQNNRRKNAQILLTNQIKSIPEAHQDPTMMLLIGININLTKKPTNPITTNPIAVRTATFVNSVHPTKPIDDRIRCKIDKTQTKATKKEN